MSSSRKRRARQQQALKYYRHQQILTSTAIVDIFRQEEEGQPRRGSVPGRKTVLRNKYEGYHRLMSDYFYDPPVFDEMFFRRRFRITKHMFLDICHAVSERNDYFKRRCNAAGLPGFTTVQKVTAALRILAYGGAADRLDEYFHMGQSTILESVRQFTSTMVDIYGDRYLRQPNAQDVAKLLAKAEERGFPGMLGSIDCMHWEWEKCPTRLHGQYRGHHKKPTIILEAVASHNLHIWHAFFGMPGSLNDINVLHRSHVFDNISSGTCVPVTFTVNGRVYNMGYFLADGIYPPWATLVKGLRCPQTQKEKYYTMKQSAYRKDVECAFGVLQAKYQIVKGPARTWKAHELKKIMECVIIMHNMGIEYKEGLQEIRIEEYEDATPPRLNPNRNVPEVHTLIAAHRRIRSRPAHEQLTADLIEHVWSTYGAQ